MGRERCGAERPGDSGGVERAAAEPGGAGVGGGDQRFPGQGGELDADPLPLAERGVQPTAAVGGSDGPHVEVDPGQAGRQGDRGHLQVGLGRTRTPATATAAASAPAGASTTTNWVLVPVADQRASGTPGRHLDRARAGQLPAVEPAPDVERPVNARPAAAAAAGTACSGRARRGRARPTTAGRARRRRRPSPPRGSRFPAAPSESGPAAARGRTDRRTSGGTGRSLLGCRGSGTGRPRSNPRPRDGSAPAATGTR